MLQILEFGASDTGSFETRYLRPRPEATGRVLKAVQTPDLQLLIFRSEFCDASPFVRFCFIVVQCSATVAKILQDFAGCKLARLMHYQLIEKTIYHSCSSSRALSTSAGFSSVLLSSLLSLVLAVQEVAQKNQKDGQVNERTELFQGPMKHLR